MNRKAGNRRFSVFNGAGDDSRRSLFPTKTTDVVTEVRISLFINTSTVGLANAISRVEVTG